MSSKRYTTSQKLSYYKRLARKKPSGTVYSGRGAYRRRRVYTGRGAYRTRSKASKNPVTGLVTESVNDVGRRIGANIGSGLGELGSEVYKFFTGRGSYEVLNNSLLAAHGNPDMIPIVNKPNKPGAVIIRKSEYICDIVSGSAGTFSNRTFSINPGLINTFQWLSQIAVNFDEYEFCGLYFEFRTMSVDALNSTNTALGQLIMAVDYNAANPPFSSKQQMENYEAAVSIKPSQSVRFFVECSKALNVLTDLYVRGGSVPTGQDVRLYDLGLLNVATNGMQASNVNIGELWVCYEVCLWKTRLYTSLGLSSPWFSASSSSWSDITPFNGFAAGADSDSTLPIVIASNLITFPTYSLPQTYNVYLNWYGDVAAVISFPALLATNCTLAITQSTPTSGDTSRGVTFQLVILTQGNVVPTLGIGGGGTLPTTPAGGNIWISRVSPGFAQS